MPGGIKRPAAMHKLAGNPNKKPLPKEVPAKEGLPVRPGNLRDKEAREEWGRMIKLLEGHRVLTPHDQRALQLYCNTWSIYRQAEKELLRGFTVVNSKGNVIQHPAVPVLQSARTALQQMLKEFGLTPASRNRVVVKEEEKKGLALFLKSDAG